MRQRIFRHYWLLIAVLIIAALLLTVGPTLAQPPTPHGVIEGDDCLSCHEAGVADALRLSRDHMGRNNEDCGICHEPSGAFADDMPHPVVGREDCLACHSLGIGTILARSHLDRTNDQCELCHVPSPALLEPTAAPVVVEPTPTLTVAEPTPSPTPHATVEVGPPPSGTETCASCHQRTAADEGHATFIRQLLGDSEVGATLFAQQCATCHGEDGTMPVGEDGKIINSEAYLGAHDDADILKDIGINSHGEALSFVEDYGGPLSWEEVLDLAAFVRSWGGLTTLAPGTPAVGNPTYVDTIGPLFTEQCGLCHIGIPGALSVADYDALMAGGSSGPVVVPGDPEGSRIVEVLQGEHYAKLSEAELDLLIEWIANGAPEAPAVGEAPPSAETHPVPLIGTHQSVACEECHIEGEQEPEYVCANCHQPPESHLEQACDTCHTPEGWGESAASVVAQSPQIPHPLEGQDDCLMCHDPAGQIKPAPADHEGRLREQCRLCHEATQ